MTAHWSHSLCPSREVQGSAHRMTLLLTSQGQPSEEKRSRPPPTLPATPPSGRDPPSMAPVRPPSGHRGVESSPRGPAGEELRREDAGPRQAPHGEDTSLMEKKHCCPGRGLGRLQCHPHQRAVGSICGQGVYWMQLIHLSVSL